MKAQGSPSPQPLLDRPLELWGLDFPVCPGDNPSSQASPHPASPIPQCPFSGESLEKACCLQVGSTVGLTNRLAID